jgi:DNA-binding MarR family transcriptional regulator
MSRVPAVPFATTLRIRDACLCLHAQRAARALARRFDDAFRPLELTNGQFSLLMALNRPVAASLGELAGLLGMDRTTLTAALKPLERRGLIVVAYDDEDRRSRRVRLTSGGRSLLARAVRVWEKMHAEVEVNLAPRKLDRLRKDLVALEAEG